MRIAGIQKLTLLDYPGRTAATLFTPGCNFRCPFCHNSELVAPDASAQALPDLPFEEVLAFLKKRSGLLDGVCLSGGEPLLQPDIAEFCDTLHTLGFAVKLDTNGTNPALLQTLLEAQLVDYVAMDVKNCLERYAETIGLPTANLEDIGASVALLAERAPAFEFRTTVARELHTAQDLEDLARWIGERLASATHSEQADPAPWYIQNFKDSDTVLAGEGVLSPWPEDDLREVLPALQTAMPGARLRGIA